MNAPKARPALDGVVQQYLDSSWEFLELVPRLESVRMRVRGAPSLAEIRAARRVIVLAMSLGRKFIKSGEPTYVAGIMTRVNVERKDRIPQKMRKNFRILQHQLAEDVKGLDALGLSITHADGTTTTPADSWLWVSYGRVLHGDHEKWMAAREHAWEAVTVTASRYLPELRRIIQVTREALEHLNDLGVFEGVVSEDTLFIVQDIWAPDGTSLLQSGPSA